MPELRVAMRLSDLAPGYQGFVVDLWGVLHDGVTAFPAALACLAALRAAGKPVVILSNAPRRAAEVAARNRALGITEAHFDAVLSSGEETWRHLKTRPDEWYSALGPRCHHVGPERDKGMLEGLDYDFVAGPGEADFLLLTGAHDSGDRVEDYQYILDAGIDRGLPIVCANPDLVVIRGGRREICAGAIAARYREMGGKVRQHGKPDPAVFHRALALVGLEAAPTVLTIGDSLATDVAGARAAGLASLFIVSGIHAEALGAPEGSMPEPQRMEALFERYGQRPDAAMPALVW